MRELVRETVVPRRTSTIDDAVRVVRARTDPREPAVLRVLDEQAHEVGAVGIAQRGDVVHVAVARICQPVEVSREIAAFVISHLLVVNQPKARGHPAVGIGRVGAVDRLLDLSTDGGAGRHSRLVAVDDHDVDVGRTICRGLGRRGGGRAAGRRATSAPLLRLQLRGRKGVPAAPEGWSGGNAFWSISRSDCDPSAAERIW